jgi:uncharacterized protein with HEPN domain
MRTEKLYLTDIVEAADAIARFLRDIEMEDFLNDELRQSAVLQKLMVIGEASSHLSEELRSRHAQVKWRSAIGLRNLAIHEYFGVTWETVWITATQDVPLFRQQVADILAAEEK